MLLYSCLSWYTHIYRYLVLAPNTYIIMRKMHIFPYFHQIMASRGLFFYKIHHQIYLFRLIEKTSVGIHMCVYKCGLLSKNLSVWSFQKICCSKTALTKRLWMCWMNFNSMQVDLFFKWIDFVQMCKGIYFYIRYSACIPSTWARVLSTD